MSFVSAISFSPENLVFNLTKGEKQCKKITISSDSIKIAVSDKWAENKDAVWNVNLFDKTSSYHGLSVSYEKELPLEERNVEVCLSGNKAGEYHGAVLLTEEQKGNSVIQMVVWVKTVINGNPEEEKKVEVEAKKEISNSNNLVTGAAVSLSENKDVVPIWKIIALIVGILVLVIIAIIVYQKRGGIFIR